MNFQQLTQKVFQLHSEGTFVEAYDLATREAPHFPEAARDITYWRISLLFRLERKWEAMDLFADLLSAGHWIGPAILNQDPDMAPLKGDPMFEAMAAQCLTRYEAAREAARPGRIIEEPETAAQRAPLLVALHSNGSSADREVSRWRPATRDGWRVAMLQSSQLWDEGRYAWTDQTVAIPEVKNHLQELTAGGAVDESRILVGGMSMGAGTGLRMALTGELPARGFIAVAPWLPDLTELKAALSVRRPASVRGYIIVGGHDAHCVALAQEIQSLMAGYGLACEVEHHSDLAHAYPDSFEQSLSKAIAFVMDR